MSKASEKIKYNPDYNREYHKNNKDTRNNYSKNYYLKNKQQRQLDKQEYYLKNKKKFKLRSKKYYLENRDKMLLQTRARKLKKYGITLKIYDDMVIKQQGCCALCGTHVNELKKILHVDHCHKTGKVRGLLCSKCNSALGLFSDNKQLLSKVVNYLEFYGN